MKRLPLLAGVAVSILAAQWIVPVEVWAQAPAASMWRVTPVNRCPKADSLFGRYWRSHASVIRIRRSPQRDTTVLRGPDRQVSWTMAGSSHLVGTEVVIRLPGEHPTTDSARIELTLHFIDSMYRASEQAQVELQIGDSLRMHLQDPEIDYPNVAGVRGVPIAATYQLTPEQSLALARLPGDVSGSVGPFSFIMYDWELWDINSVYRGALCGTER